MTSRIYLVPAAVLVAATAAAHAAPTFANWNGSYDLNTQTQKYLPIQATAITVANDDCMAALQARRASLGVTSVEYLIGDPANGPLQGTNAAGVRNLLSTGKSAFLQNANNVNQIPMVVISGGRSRFLGRMLRSAGGDRQIPAPPVGTDPWQAEADLNSLAYWNLYDSGVDDDTPVQWLWFDDRRTKRPLYVIVDAAEYPVYYQALQSVVTNADRQVALVGCRAMTPNGAASGFGTQRLCAIGLMKQLGYASAWTVDDNVGTVTGAASLAALEARLPPNALGLTVQPDNSRDIEDLKHNAAKLRLRPEDQQNFALGTNPPDLFQQVVLWNIAELRRSGLEFSPLFAESAEDVSLTKHVKMIRNGQALGYAVAGASVVKVGLGDPQKGHTADAPLQGQLAGPTAAWNQAFLAARTARATVKQRVWQNDGALAFRMNNAPYTVATFDQAVPTQQLASTAIPKIGSVWVGAHGANVNVYGEQTEPPERTGAKIVENILVACIAQVNGNATPFGREIPTIFSDQGIAVTFSTY